MARSGSIDASCGVFSYQIFDPPVPLEEQPRECFDRDEFGDHGDVGSSWVSAYSGYACAETSIKPIVAGNESSFRHFSTVTNKVPYQYNIWWKEGCLLENSKLDSMYAANPLNVKDPGATVCQKTLIDNYKKCNNGGVGGRVQIGCLVYEFKVEKKE